MQINKVMSLLDILTSWLEDNINMESDLFFDNDVGNDSNLLIVFYVQIMPDDFVMQLHRF
ncbi:hypothetical protein DBZ78_14365 [Salmonella enterica subsp. enterica serovar Brancaster]|nr:hypothetical protein DBZ78_14365 [Salmonella enterica subsp. enterica serovar Brancaster]